LNHAVDGRGHGHAERPVQVSQSFKLGALACERPRQVHVTPPEVNHALLAGSSVASRDPSLPTSGDRAEIVVTSHAASGYAIEDGELWTEAGRLILQARQLRRILERG
jgi:hypothetical protein